MTIDSIVSPGIERIYNEDFEAQKDYIEKICLDVRNIEPDIIYKAKGFFVPNDSYLIEYFGDNCILDGLGIYSTPETCLWLHNLVLPIFSVGKTIEGLAGFNPFRYLEAHETKNRGMNYYSYSSKEVFNKGDYLYMLPGTFEAAYEKGYLVITDGIFDTLSFAKEGFLSGALLGSFVSMTVLAQLRFIKTIILAVDNDKAGQGLYARLCKNLNNVILFSQDKYKDSDDIIKSKDKDRYLKGLQDIIYSSMPINKFLGFK